MFFARWSRKNVKAPCRRARRTSYRDASPRRVLQSELDAAEERYMFAET
jgi:hypothetical protein